MVLVCCGFKTTDHLLAKVRIQRVWQRVNKTARLQFRKFFRHRTRVLTLKHPVLKRRKLAAPLCRVGTVKAGEDHTWATGTLGNNLSPWINN